MKAFHLRSIDNVFISPLYTIYARYLLLGWGAGADANPRIPIIGLCLRCTRGCCLMLAVGRSECSEGR